MGKYSNMAIICTAIAYILFAICWGADIGEIANWPGIIILGLWAIIIFSLNPMICLRYPFVIFTAVTNALGVLIIEQTNLYLTELNTYGHANHSLFYLLFTWFLVLSTITILEVLLPLTEICKLNKHSTFNGTLQSTGALIFPICGGIFIAFFLWQFLSVLPHPFFLEHMDRFLYSKKYISLWQGKLIGYFTYMLPVIVAGTFHSNYRKISMSALIVFFIYKFWTGEKFGAFFLVFYSKN